MTTRLKSGLTRFQAYLLLDQLATTHWTRQGMLTGPGNARQVSGALQALRARGVVTGRPAADVAVANDGGPPGEMCWWRTMTNQEHEELIEAMWDLVEAVKETDDDDD